MESQRLHSGNVLLKFDLHHSDEGGPGPGVGDESDTCLLSCFPTCQMPVYHAGQMITGHLMIRPVSRTIISGVTLSFGGRCETSWREGCTKWNGKRNFFLERRHLIENRLIPLDTKWHRFDFEYRVPVDLPSSAREKSGHHTYYATAIVHQPHGPDIETHEALFRLRGHLDVDSLPGWLRSPVERREEMYRSSTAAASAGADGEVAAAGAGARQASQSDNDSASAFIQEADDEVVIGARLCLNRRMVIPGDRLTAEGTVANRTPVAVTCTVKFQQVSAFIADYGLEKRGRRSPLYQHYRTNMRLVVRDLVPRSSSSSSSSASSSSSSSSSSSLVIPAGKTKSFACYFDVPKVPPSTVSSLLRRFAEIGRDSRQDVRVIDDRDPIIRFKYFCRLEVVPQWSKPNKMVIPVEVLIGSHRSLGLSSSTPTAIDAGCSTRSSRRNSRRSSSGGRDGDGSAAAGRTPPAPRSGRDGKTASSGKSSSVELSVFDVRNEPLNYEDYFRENRRTTPSTKRQHPPSEVVRDHVI